MTRRFVTWAGGCYLASSIGFGVTLPCLGLLFRIGEHRPTLLDVAFIPLVSLIESFHEASYSLRALPVFLAALLLWIAAVRRLPSLEATRGRMVLALSCWAIATAALRLTLVEYPWLRDSPLVAWRADLLSPIAFAQVVGTWSGLVLPRLLVPRLGAGAFVGTDAPTAEPGGVRPRASEQGSRR